jgi:hypothetical protein
LGFDWRRRGLDWRRGDFDDGSGSLNNRSRDDFGLLRFERAGGEQSRHHERQERE